MIDYVKAHWRGELSLAQSYWVNGFLLSVLVNVGALAVEDPIWGSGLDLQTSIYIALLIITLLAVVTIWQFVGIWRSATKTSKKTGRTFWPGVAKGFVVLGIIGATFNVGTTGNDLVNVLGALRDPMLTEYVIERRGQTDLLLMGAINEKSVSEIIDALEDPSITILRVNSHGGLIEPGAQLARHIRDYGMMVMGEGQCVSACVMLLAASPTGAINPGTTITFHRFEALAEFTNPEVRKQSAQELLKVEDIYKEFGLANWAIETARRQQFWTPTVSQLIRMGLIEYIYEPNQQRFVFANEYCGDHPSECNGLDKAEGDFPGRKATNTQSGRAGDYETEVGTHRMEDGRYDEALEHYDKALDEAPDHRGALMGRAIVFIQTERYDLATAELDYLIDYLTRTLEEDDATGRGVLAAAYSNRGIVHDRLGKYEKALADYVSALNTDEGTVSGPDVVHKILYGSEKVSSVRKRAQYIYEQLQLPESERLMRIPELDAK